MLKSRYPKNIKTMVESKHELAKFNVFYYWRRFKMRQTMHKYTPLETRIKNGDFEFSDYSTNYIFFENPNN